MGLLDVLNGMQNGPRGQRGPTSSGGGGMSPMTMAILGLLAFKAVKSFTGSQPSARPASPGAVPGGGTSNAALPGRRRPWRSAQRWIGRRPCWRRCRKRPKRRLERPAQTVSAERP